MSGGTLDYLCYKVAEAKHMIRHPWTPERRAFVAHLEKVAEALKAIEWVDSGDGHPDEVGAIRACLNKSDVLAAVTEDAKRALAELQGELERLSVVTINKEMRK